MYALPQKRLRYRHEEHDTAFATIHEEALAQKNTVSIPAYAKYKESSDTSIRSRTWRTLLCTKALGLGKRSIDHIAR
jgi:hypothetical protein